MVSPSTVFPGVPGCSRCRESQLGALSGLSVPPHRSRGVVGGLGNGLEWLAGRIRCNFTKTKTNGICGKHAAGETCRHQEPSSCAVWDSVPTAGYNSPIRTTPKPK